MEQPDRLCPHECRLAVAAPSTCQDPRRWYLAVVFVEDRWKRGTELDCEVEEGGEDVASMSQPNTKRVPSAQPAKTRSPLGLAATDSTFDLQFCARVARWKTECMRRSRGNKLKVEKSRTVYVNTPHTRPEKNQYPNHSTGIYRVYTVLPSPSALRPLRGGDPVSSTV